VTYTFIARACADLLVSACCRVMKVSTSGFSAWQANPVTAKDLVDAYLTNTIVDIHRMSRRSYGSPLSTPSCASVRGSGTPRSGSGGSRPRQGSPASIADADGAAPSETVAPSPPTTW